MRGIRNSKSLYTYTIRNFGMAEINCKKCHEKMHKKGMIQSGNSKYDVYRCNECGHEEMKAIGVNPTYHR